MIVPFIYNIYDYTKEKPMCLWIFYKFINFCTKYSMPIIAQEEFFKPVKYYQNNNHSAAKDNDVLDFTLPKQEDINKIISYKINLECDNNIIKKYGNTFKAAISLVKYRDKLLENEINTAIEEIEKKCNKKIKCIICWFPIKSLQYVCNKKNIKLINYELSSIRKGTYNTTLGYFAFETKYSTKQIKNNYKDFKSKYIFQRNELLALLLKKEYLEYINHLNKNPIYEFGIAGGLKHDVLEFSLDHTDFIKMCELTMKLTDKKNITFRGHPANPCENKYGFVLDTSSNSIEWILKCKRIINNVSNIGFETMLYGKTAYVLSKDMPFYYKNTNTLKRLEESVIDLEYLNYIIFGFFAPYELMFDINYINWRLTNPNINEIYNYNLNFILNKNKLDTKVFNLETKKRLNFIIKNTHKIEKFKYNTYNDIFEKEIKEKNKLYKDNKDKEDHINNLDKIIEEKNKLLKNLENIIEEKNKNIYKLDNIITDKEKKINQISSENIYYSKELNKILNSKSWKITKPLRIITNKIKKNEKN